MNWLRVNRTRPCPACGKANWCSIASDGSCGWCNRVSLGSVKSREDGAGMSWLHIYVDKPMAVREHTPPKAREIDPAMEPMARACFKALSAPARQRAAHKLGVSFDALVRLWAGWSREHQAVCFPMRDGEERIIGLRMRPWQGRKFCQTGSHNGLFIPAGLTGAGPLLVCEGPTDTAAMLTLGFDAIGRPCNTGGKADLLAWLLRLAGPRNVVILRDGDKPGSAAHPLTVRGADAMANALFQYPHKRVVRSVKVLAPPPEYKDARAWVQAGADRAAVEAWVKQAPYRRGVVKLAETRRVA